MFRIIRRSTLDALIADSAALPGVRDELAQAKTKAEQATDSAVRAENVAMDQLRELARTTADAFKFSRDLEAARAERDQVEAEAQRQLEEIRADVAGLIEATRHPETGQTMRAAIALGVLRNLIEDAKARGLELARPFDLVEVLLFDPVPGSGDTARDADETLEESR